MLKSAGYRVTALDIVASDMNSKQVNEIYSFSDYNKPLIQFLSSLPQEERVVLVGHSLGGVNMSVTMKRCPQKISLAVFGSAYINQKSLAVFGSAYVNQEVLTLNTPHPLV